MQTKVCTKCGVEKPIEDFPKRRNSRIGYYPACRPCTLQRYKEYRQRNYHKRTLAGRQHARASYYRLKDTVFEGYGSVCACCGETDKRFLSLDHVHGGGNAHIIAKGTSAHYRDALLRNFPSDYQLLCFNCNFAKGLYGECPHKTDVAEFIARAVTHAAAA